MRLRYWLMDTDDVLADAMIAHREAIDNYDRIAADYGFYDLSSIDALADMHDAMIIVLHAQADLWRRRMANAEAN